jgi:hypothetical protein
MSTEQLVEWLKCDLQDARPIPSGDVLVAFVEDAKRIIKLHLERPKRLRPSAVARKLNTLANNLGKAAKAAETLGSQGLQMIVAALDAKQDPGDLDPKQHILYLQRMAAWSRKAAQMARDHSLSTEDALGGPTPTQELRAIVASLAQSYQEMLRIRPAHTVDKDTHLAERRFAGFVKQALRLYAPAGVMFEPKLIDNVVREKLSILDYEFFDPPPFP